MLELEEVRAGYEKIDVLRGVDMSVGEGEIVALLGRNGMGKTTTIRTISGLTPIKSGRVTLSGEAIGGLAPHRIARRGVASVPQGRGIFGSLTVLENLTISARGASADWDLERVLSLFPILGERAKVRGTLLSGGEQQMLAIGRALMTNPRLLLLDEPSEGLAPAVIEHIAEVVSGLASTNLSILLVEQNLPLALTLADRVVVMSQGQVVLDEPAASFAANREAQSRLLGVGVPTEEELR
jgi:branched-chain amino acid transport system ATP-binding protein